VHEGYISSMRLSNLGKAKLVVHGVQKKTDTYPEEGGKSRRRTRDIIPPSTRHADNRLVLCHTC